jgi:hypothetical protein
MAEKSVAGASAEGQTRVEERRALRVATRRAERAHARKTSPHAPAESEPHLVGAIPEPMVKAPGRAALRYGVLLDNGSVRVDRTFGDLSRTAMPVDLVTFEPWRARNRRRPFGRAVAMKNRLNALHVMPAGDDWYQYPDLMESLAFVALHVGPRTLGYGSSMGGYAATSYADAAGLRTVLALSPQFAIDRKLVPFESRWSRDAARIAFRPDHGRVARGTRLILLYDPANRDAEHARLILEGADGPVEMLEVPGGGHPVGTTLAEAGVLSRLLLGVLAEQRLPEGFGADMLAALPGSPSYHRHLARHARGKARLQHLAAGLALAPHDDRLRYTMALHLQAMGRIGDALDEAKAALDRRPHSAKYAALVQRLEDMNAAS